MQIYPIINININNLSVSNKEFYYSKQILMAQHLSEKRQNIYI